MKEILEFVPWVAAIAVLVPLVLHIIYWAISDTLPYNQYRVIERNTGSGYIYVVQKGMRKGMPWRDVYRAGPHGAQHLEAFLSSETAIEAARELTRKEKIRRDSRLNRKKDRVIYANYE